MRWTRLSLVAGLLVAAARAETVTADPTDYKTVVKALKPGDTLQLAPGDYPAGLTIRDLHGDQGSWITIRGPASEPRARFLGDPGQTRNTIEIRSGSFVALENLEIDGGNVGGVFGVSAGGHDTHHIRIEGCRIVGHGAGQGTVGISTKTATWGWIIRRNTIVGAGTGMYLGNSDGTDPFIGGLIEHNLFDGSLGYNVQIKHQRPRPDVPGIPKTPQRTIIRHNVFFKGDRTGDSGPRPNLLLGTFPDEGAGSEDLYEVYGNLFLGNRRESLLQAAGRVCIHDNVFVDCPGNTAVYLRDHNGPLKLAYVYHNTFYSGRCAIRFASQAREGHRVAGNLMLMDLGVAGRCTIAEGNIRDRPRNAGKYVRSPSTEPGKMDFHPLPDRARGEPLDLSAFESHTDHDRDFDGEKRAGSVFRGAYSGPGAAEAWRLARAVKEPRPAEECK